MSETIEPDPGQDVTRPPIAGPPGGVQFAPQQAPKKNGMTFGLLTLLGGGLVAVGSFLPWITITAPILGTVSRNGIDGGGDGVVTLVLGSILFAIGLARVTASVPGWLQRLPIAFGALAGVIALADFGSVNEKLAEISPSSSAYVAASVGSGLYMVAIGAVFATIGGLVTDQMKTNRS
ncbi:hypothetical protein ACFHYQ_21860 [Sphaerimonospora cavernae]|uniref:Uncharacterized protein n=1 Tax=Sphaerimonospora cavernae TaxID=1740611 RepID=A0ABV6U9T3_9ACTN